MVSSSASAWLDGQLGKGMELAAAAVDAGSRCAGDCALMAHVWHASLLTRARELPSAARVLADTAAGGRRLGAAAALCHAEIALARGDLDEAVRRAEDGLKLAKDTGLRVLLPVGHFVLALCALHRTDIATGLRYTNQLGDDALLGHARHMPGQSAWASARILEARDGVAGVGHLIDGIVTDERLLRELLAGQPAASSWLVRAARGLGEEGLAMRTAGVARELAVRNPGFRTLRAAALHATALLERDADRLLAAARQHVDLWAEASAAEDAGILLAERPGEQDAAVASLNHALDAYVRAGASRDMFRVASRLRGLGVRRGHLSRFTGRAAPGTGRLTDTEYAVAELVSQGYTNGRVGQQLFISTHTVAFHLKKIFRKLDVTSRVELAGAWHRLTER